MIGSLLSDARKLGVVAPDYQSGIGKGLEAEVLFGLAKAAQELGPVIARNHRGDPISGRFVMRGGPGNLELPIDREGCCYFEVTVHGDQVFELHNSLELRGRSQEKHEMDVCVLWGLDVDAARAGRQRELPGPPLVGIEVKEFGLRTTVSKNVARAFFACVVDFIPTWAMEAQTLREKIIVAQLGQLSHPEDRFWLLSTGKASNETKRFLKAYAIELIDELDQSKLSTTAAKIAGLLNWWSMMRRREPAEPKPMAPAAQRVASRRIRQIDA